MITFCRYKVVDSTNLQVRRLWEDRDGGTFPLVAIAEEQSAGLGRSGRNWASPPGGLWMSLAWPAELPLAGYAAAPLVVGLAVCQALEDSLGISAGIKWPNDIMAGERKLAGILCQAIAPAGRPCLIAGIGINGNYPAETIQGALRHPATSLQDELGHSTDLEKLSSAILEELRSLLRQFEASGLKFLAGAIRERLTWVGETVYSQDAVGEKPVQGIMEGIDDQGRLLLRTGQTTTTHVCGELKRLHRNDFGADENGASGTPPDLSEQRPRIVNSPTLIHLKRD